MRRLSLVATSVVILLALFAPAALAAEPVSSTGSVIVSVQGTVDVPADANPEAVVVVDGTATISGDADTVVIAGGTATLTGATVDSLVVIDGRADLAAGTTVGRVSTLGGTVTQAAGAEITGRMASFDVDLAALALLLIPVALALAVGFAIAAVVAGLLVAAFGAGQVRDTRRRSRSDPVMCWWQASPGASACRYSPCCDPPHRGADRLRPAVRGPARPPVPGLAGRGDLDRRLAVARSRGEREPAARTAPRCWG